MDDFKRQIRLYRLKNNIRNEISPLKLLFFQKQYIRWFIAKNRKTILLIFALILSIISIEIIIPIFTNIFVNSIFHLSITDIFYKYFLIIFIILLVYLALYFTNIKMQKSILLKFINELRENWVKLYFRKSISNISPEDNGKLLVKITYHLSLLQVGLSNAFFSVFEWVILTFGVLLVTTIIDTKLLVISFIVTIINLVIFYIGYVVSIYYVGQDQTLYSKILQHVSDSINNLYFNKQHNKRDCILGNLRKLVEMDTFLRVRREIFLHFGDKIIFSILIIMSIVGYIIGSRWPIFTFNNLQASIIYATIFILLTRLVYLSLRIGLYFFPLKLGLIISIPNVHIKSILSDGHRIYPLRINNFEIHSKKFKLNNSHTYLRNVKYIFEKGKSYLFCGENGSGKSLLANIISGTAPFSTGKPWVTIINNENRFLYFKWAQENKSLYYVNPHFSSNLTLYEILNDINSNSNDNFITLQEILLKYREFKPFDFIFSKDKSPAVNINKRAFSFSQIAIIQLLYCIINKPDVVVIDNLWLDINNKDINETIKLVKKELNKSILICFSTVNAEIIDYDQKYYL